VKTWQERYPQEVAADPEIDDMPTFNLHSTHDTRDFRDNGTMNKVHPNPNHWSREDRQDDFYKPGGRR